MKMVFPCHAKTFVLLLLVTMHNRLLTSERMMMWNVMCTTCLLYSDPHKT